MSDKNLIRKIISNNFVRKIAKATKISDFGKKVYFNIFAPKDHKIFQTISNITAQFYVKTYTQLIYLTETVIGIGDERPIIESIIKNLKPGDVVYDIGAFLGFHAVFFAKFVGKNGKIIAFEPSLASYQALLENAKLNDLNNIMAFNLALGSQEKEMILKGNDSSMYSFSQEYGDPIFNQKTHVVPGDLLVAQNKILSANVVKIDVEGYEYSVIIGLEKTLKKDSCRFICCEVHPTLLPKDITAKMVIDKIKSFGFAKIETHGRGDTFHIFCYK